MNACITIFLVSQQTATTSFYNYPYYSCYFILYQTVPDREPTSVTAEGNSPFTLYVDWTGVDRVSMNGDPLGYHIFVFHQSDGVTSLSNLTVPFNEESVTFEGLEPSNHYISRVCAFNSLGDGPCEQATGRTMDSGLFLFYFCVLYMLTHSHRFSH